MGRRPATASHVCTDPHRWPVVEKRTRSGKRTTLPVDLASWLAVGWLDLGVQCGGGMRRPRRRRPGQLLDLTIRCHHSEFRLLPSAERREILGFWLAKALRRSPGVRLLAVCQMSNHLHLVIEDQLGEASDFMQYFIGHAAKRLNRLDGVRGAVFERRFAEIVVLDDGALLNRIAYAVTNPVEASLVRAVRDWTGLCLATGATAHRESFALLDERRYAEALEDASATGASVDREDFIEVVELEVAPLEETLARELTRVIAEREARLQRDQTGIVGMRRVLEASPFDRPQMSSRSAQPLCFASERKTRGAFVAGWLAFVDAFRQASSDFRSGILDVVFPEHSFRPSTAASTG